MNKEPKVFAHASYVGTTGYNNHTRDFFRHLQKHISLKVRNFTIGKNFKWPNDEPHNGDHIKKIDKKLLTEQVLWTGDKTRGNFPIYKNYPNNFNHNINLVLAETDHYLFYDPYTGPKIAYNVWETTEQPDNFFNKLLEYDQIWVPSKWQAKCTIEQGADPDKVKVVPEGVDVNTFYPDDHVKHKDYDDGRFKFIIFGRWDYRKSTKEIIQTFLDTFSKDEPVDLIVSIDNPYSGDGIETTEERLKVNGFDDDRIKIKHFPSRNDYIKYLKKGHVFLSCARSEGWNLPLIEAMACGTPSIYSSDSGQMEFAEGKGLPVKIKSYQLANSKEDMQFSNNAPGYFPEPDFDDLSKVMRDTYINYDKHKLKALTDSKIIHKEFNWDRVAEIGRDTLVDFLNNYQPPLDSNKINITLTPDIKVEITGDNNKLYNVQFNDNGKIIFEDNISNNMWCGIPSDKLSETLSIQINEKPNI